MEIVGAAKPMPRLSTTTSRSVGWRPPGFGSFGVAGLICWVGAFEALVEVGSPGAGTVGVISSGWLGTSVMVGVDITRSTTPHPPSPVNDTPRTTPATAALMHPCTPPHGAER